MALYAFDGTWNEDRDGTQRDTNVCKFYQAYERDEGDLRERDATQDERNLYLAGIGTRFGWLGKAIGGAFGIGGRWRVSRAMKRLRHNLAAGDRSVDVVGFSRGAATAVDFVNRVCTTYGDRVQVRFVGLWDCVACFGVPGNSINIGWQLDLPPAVERCCHAMALDEGRINFPLERLSMAGPPAGSPRRTLAPWGAKGPPYVREGGQLFEVWFRGVHSDIGGGNGNVWLSSITLHWMLLAARQCGVKIPHSEIDRYAAAMRPDAPIKRAPLDAGRHRRTVRPDDSVHVTVLWRPNHNNPPPSVRVVTDTLEPGATATVEEV